MAQTLTPATIANGKPAAEKVVADPVEETSSDPVEASDSPDPSQVRALTLGTLGNLVSLFEQLAPLIPLGHSLAGRLAAARAAYDALVYHATPPAE